MDQSAPEPSRPLGSPVTADASPGVPTHSLPARYAFKLGSNLLSVVLSLLSQVIVLRALGPHQYGQFSYLSAFFTNTFSFLDGGTITAFYTHLSQKPRETRLITLYWRYILGGTGVLALLVAAACWGGWNGLIWPEIPVSYISYAFVYGGLILACSIASYIVDAYGLTVWGEILRIIQTSLITLLVFVFFTQQMLDLPAYYLCLLAGLLLFLAGTAVILRRHHLRLYPTPVPEPGDVRKYTRYFYQYAAPLFASTIISLLIVYCDRWMLQIFAGSTEQGIFGLAYQLAASSMIFTAALTPLILREFSISHVINDSQQLRSRYELSYKLMFMLSCVICLFAAFHAADLTRIIGGQAYVQASIASSIMLLGPIHQSGGQIGGSFLLATGRTRLYASISIISGLLSLPLLYVMIATPAWGGLDLGSTGLAIKLTLTQMITVEVTQLICLRILGQSYWRNLAHRLFTLLLITGIAIIGWYCSSMLLEPGVGRLFVSLGIYGILIAVSLWLLPVVMPLDRSQMLSLIDQLKALRIRSGR